MGIIDEWIVKNRIHEGLYDSIKSKFKIKVPSGITIPLILKDLNEKFVTQPVEISSKEVKIHGTTSLKINSGKNTKLISEFKYYPELTRSFSEVGFLLTDFDDLDENEINDLFNLAIPFGVVLPLEIGSVKFAENIKGKGLEYFILIDDASDHIEFELNEEFDLNRLSRNIKSIISTFNSPEIFFVDGSNFKFSNNILSFISSEFQKKGRRISELNEIVEIKGDNKADLISLLHFHQSNLRSGDRKLYKLKAMDWLNIQDEINDFTKKGNKIIRPTKIF